VGEAQCLVGSSGMKIPRSVSRNSFLHRKFHILIALSGHMLARRLQSWKRLVVKKEPSTF
jgi:hypothetical protein